MVCRTKSYTVKHSTCLKGNNMRGKEEYQKSILQSIEVWLLNPRNVGRWIKARDLYPELKNIFYINHGHEFGVNQRWPYSVKSFSMQLLIISPVLVQKYGMKTRIYHGYKEYIFVQVQSANNE